jgi:hypothetical protein
MQVSNQPVGGKSYELFFSTDDYLDQVVAGVDIGYYLSKTLGLHYDFIHNTIEIKVKVHYFISFQRVYIAFGNDPIIFQAYKQKKHFCKILALLSRKCKENSAT